MTNNLKPCPFCLSADIRASDHPEGEGWSFIQCRCCLAHFSLHDPLATTAERWNRRDGEKELAKEAYQAGCDAEKIAEFGGSLTFEEWWRMKENE